MLYTGTAAMFVADLASEKQDLVAAEEGTGKRDWTAGLVVYRLLSSLELFFPARLRRSRVTSYI